MTLPYANSATKGMRHAEVVDIAAFVKGESEDAWLISDGLTTAWIPKSQAEDNNDGTFQMPLWLAEDRGFI